MVGGKDRGRVRHFSTVNFYFYFFISSSMGMGVDVVVIFHMLVKISADPTVLGNYALREVNSHYNYSISTFFY